MRRRIEARVRELWDGERSFWHPLSVALLPVSGLFRLGVALRNLLWDRRLLRPTTPPIPTISIGNLAVGGTGKTPVAAWLVRHLLACGARPALVARGYGVDELHLHRRWNPEAPVLAQVDRQVAVSRAAAAGAGCAVLDDGFQHRRLGRALDVVLLAAEHAFPGPLLPRGRYREPEPALGRADVVVVTRKVAPESVAEKRVAAVRARHPHVLVVRLDLVSGAWTDLEGAPAVPPEEDVLAVTSVAGPDAFVELVRRRTGHTPELLAFPDHHEYDAADAERILRAAGPRNVVTTEKDAVKLVELARLLPDVRVLPLHVEEGEEADALLARARRAAGVANRRASQREDG